MIILNKENFRIEITTKGCLIAYAFLMTFAALILLNVIMSVESIDRVKDERIKVLKETIQVRDSLQNAGNRNFNF